METYLICIWKCWTVDKGIGCPSPQIYEQGNGKLPQSSTDIVDCIMKIRANTIDIMPGLFDFSDTVQAFCPLQKKECVMCLATTKNKAAIIQELIKKNGPALIKNFQNRTEYHVFSEFTSKPKVVELVDTHVYFIERPARSSAD